MLTSACDVCGRCGRYEAARRLLCVVEGVVGVVWEVVDGTEALQALALASPAALARDAPHPLRHCEDGESDAEGLTAAQGECECYQ